MNSAQFQANYMAKIHRMTHGNPAGDVGKRIEMFGYRYSACAENVAYGYSNEYIAMRG